MKMYHFMSRLGNSSSYVSVFLQLSFLKKIFFLCWHNAVDACTLDETAGLRYSLILADMKLEQYCQLFDPNFQKTFLLAHKLSFILIKRTIVPYGVCTLHALMLLL